MSKVHWAAEGSIDPICHRVPSWAKMVDEIVCEYGPPIHRETEDGEAWYWCFDGHDLPVADNLSELLVAAAQLSSRKANELLKEQSR